MCFVGNYKRITDNNDKGSIALYKMGYVKDYYKFCYIKYTINPIGKSDKNHNNQEDRSKYLVDETIEKFNQTSSISIIRNKKTFLLHHTLVYLKKLWDG